jgi:hypothetical protein
MKLTLISATLLVATFLGTAGVAEEVRRPTPREPATTGSVPRDAGSSTKWVGLAAAPNGRVFKLDASTESLAQSAARTECEQTSGRTCRVIAVPAQWDVVVLQCSGAGRSEAFFGGSMEGGAGWIAHKKARQNGFSETQCRQIYQY